MARVPMLCLEIVEVHAPDRVMRQFGRPQHVPAIPSWGTNHHMHDQRRRLGLESLAVEVDDGTSGAGYKLWYMRYGRLLIGKPALKVGVPSGFVHSAVAERHNLSFTW
ncbi:hypothetical protein KY284_024225 [Solanum tuberosum]|nr:hypothetical protein KY284_024225 [Solanum tuberosum]